MFIDSQKDCFRQEKVSEIVDIPIVMLRNKATEFLVEEGDLTKSKASAIVNAANKKLKHGGGLARAICVEGKCLYS